MKCQRCKEREANVQIVQQISGKKPQTFYLCDICARELGISIPTFPKSAKFTPNPFKSMSGVFGSDLGLGIEEPSLSFTGTCPNCGITFDEFQKSGFLGCNSCYDAFGSRLDPVFLRTQMGKEHVGRGLGAQSTHSLPFDPMDGKSKDSTGAASKDSVDRTQENPPADRGAFRKTHVSHEKAPVKKATERTDDTNPADAEEIAALERLHLDHLIEEKRQQMKEAIAVEDYRKAATLRDAIQDLEKQKEGGKT